MTPETLAATLNASMGPFPASIAPGGASRRERRQRERALDELFGWRTRGPIARARAARRARQRGDAPAPAAQAAAALGQRTFSNAEKVEAVWRAGHLEYLLRPHQRAVYRQIKAELWADGFTKRSPRALRFVLEICRRWGKSFICALIALELCIQKPGAKVYWAAETSKQVRKILRTVLKPLLSRCPRDMLPRWDTVDSFYAFPNGSEIHIGGCEDEAKADRLRGDGCDLFIIDEAGSIGILEYVYRSIAMFMALDRGGRVFMPSTPARSPGHAFTGFCIQGEMGDGGYARHDIYSANFSAEDIARVAEEVGGVDSADWKREALVQRVVDWERAIIPEFSEAGTKKTASPNCAFTRANGRRCQEHHDTHHSTDHDFRYESAEDQICEPWCVQCEVHYDKHGPELGHEFVWAVQRPEYFDGYAMVDWGQKDPTAGLFAYYDFLKAWLVYEDEFELLKPTTIDIAECIVETEERLWGAYRKLLREAGIDPDEHAPYMRVADTDLQILRDLLELHGLLVLAARKDEKLANINDFRVKVKRRRIRIHPRCKKYRAQLRAGIWDKKRKEFERMAGFGHFDLIDAGRYGSRHVDEQRDPFPPAPSHLQRWKIPGQAVQPPPVAARHRSMAEHYTRTHSALYPSRGKKE